MGIGLSSGLGSATPDEDEPTDIVSIPSPTGNQQAVVRTDGDTFDLGIHTGAAFHRIETGDATPTFPVWNEQGNRLAVSLDGAIHLYNPGGNLLQVSEGPFDYVPLFQDSGLVYHSPEGTFRINDLEDPKETHTEIPFDPAQLTDHPLIDADELPAQADSSGGEK
jgi:hypothetical protein